VKTVAKVQHSEFRKKKVRFQLETLNQYVNGAFIQNIQMFALKVIPATQQKEIQCKQKTYSLYTTNSSRNIRFATVTLQTYASG